MKHAISLNKRNKMGTLAGRILVTMITLIMLLSVLSACGGDGKPNISIEQMQNDLKGRKVQHHWMYLQFEDDVRYKRFEVKETLSLDNTVEYYVDIFVSGLDYINDWYYSDFDGTLVLKYRKYKEGWKIERVSALEE